MPITKITKEKTFKSVFAVYCSLFTVYSLKFFQPQFKFPTSADELTSKERIIWEVSQRSDEYLPKGFITPPNQEVALRIDNPQNQILVDNIKKPTPIRKTANLISLISLVGLALHPLYSKR